MPQITLDWPEVNCILDGLQALVDRYEASHVAGALSDDECADLSNELSYAQIIRGKFEELRDSMRKACDPLGCSRTFTGA